MRLLLLVMVLGCRASDPDYPIGGGGGGGGGGVKSPDAPLGDGAGSADLVATACVLTDPRDLTTCSPGAGLTVRLGTATATTAADGTFTIARPSGPAQWDVTGSTVVESVTAYAAQTRIPVMDSAMFSELQATNGQQLVAGTGSVLVRITRAGVPVAGEAARLTPLATYDPLYDPAQQSAQWSSTATGALGAVFIAGAPTGTATLTLSAAGMTQGSLSGIPIVDGGVTFVFAAQQ